MLINCRAEFGLRRRGFVLPELLAALLIFGVALLGAAFLHGELLRRQQALQRDQAALDLAQELDERKRMRPDLSCRALARRPEIAAADAPTLSWEETLRSQLPGARYALREGAPGCAAEIDYPRPHGAPGRLRWE